MLPPVGLSHYLVVSALLFSLGFICVMSRKNIVGLLMGVELILNASNLNFVAFARYNGGAVTGEVFAVFGIVLAAAEAAIALALVLALYQYSHSIDIEELQSDADARQALSR